MKLDHRPITPTDVGIVHYIYMDETNNPFLGFEPMDLASFRPLFDELVTAGAMHLLCDDDDVVGLYALRIQTRRARHVATLESFAMHPHFRGRGYGALSIEAIVEVARAQGIRRLELLVEVDNPRAIRFYEKHGFVREGILRGAFRRAYEAHDVDEMAMARRLEVADRVHHPT